MKVFRVLLLCAMLCGVELDRAHAVALTPVVAYVLPGASLHPSAEYESWYLPSSLWFGGFAEFQMFKSISMETGALYGQRGFSQVYSDATTQVKMNSVMIPLLFRAQFSPQVSIGIGPYYSHAVGSFHSTTNDETIDTAYGFATYGADDYGMIASLRFHIRLAFSTSIVLDSRYVYGLQNVNHYGGVELYLRDIQVLGGLKFGI